MYILNFLTSEFSKTQNTYGKNSFYAISQILYTDIFQKQIISCVSDSFTLCLSKVFFYEFFSKMPYEVWLYNTLKHFF